jgi:hypothetical protein
MLFCEPPDIVSASSMRMETRQMCRCWRFARLTRWVGRLTSSNPYKYFLSVSILPFMALIGFLKIENMAEGI